MSNLSEAKRLVRAMTLKDLLSLDEYLRVRIKEARRPAPPKKAAKREVVPGSRRRSGEWTYQLEYVKCGKERCRNDRHGPYWYGYRTSGGRTISKYFGKELPGEKGDGESEPEDKKKNARRKRA
jgi:hypothetical protein